MSKILQSHSTLTIASFLRRNCNDICCKADSASAALNKWLNQTIGDGYVIHSFRHSMRDRSRAVQCPLEMIDQIGGWSKRSVGEGYGEGHSLMICFSFLEKMQEKIKEGYSKIIPISFSSTSLVIFLRGVDVPPAIPHSLNIKSKPSSSLGAAREFPFAIISWLSKSKVRLHL